MIDFADAKATLQSWMADRWTDTPIAWENSQFTPIEGQPYLRIAIAEGAAQPGPWIDPAMAGPRQAATIHIVACAPIGTGDAVTEQILTGIKAILAGQTIAGTTTRIRVQNFVGTVSGTEGAWFKKMIAAQLWVSQSNSL